jgi:hypothetical protein
VSATAGECEQRVGVDGGRDGGRTRTVGEHGRWARPAGASGRRAWTAGVHGRWARQVGASGGASVDNGRVRWLARRWVRAMTTGEQG